MRRIRPITASATAAIMLLLPALFAMPAPAMATPVAATVSADSHLRIVDLGTLGGPQDASTANAVNNHGEVVGWSAVNDPFVVHAFLWRHGKMTDLAPLWAANDINDHGVIVGNGASANGEHHGFRLANGKLTDLGTLGGDYSEARAINNRGQIVGLSRTADGMPHGYVWANGKMTELPLLAASGINDHGQIAGEYYAPPTGATHAVIYDLRSRTLTDLGTGASWFSEALAVNQRGQAAGYIGDAGPGHPVNSAFFWSKGHLTDLGAMGDDSSQAMGINDHGTVVGSTSRIGFVWRDGTMTALNGLSGGSGAAAINDHGVIVGSSGFRSGTIDTFHAVLWR